MACSPPLVLEHCSQSPCSLRFPISYAASVSYFQQSKGGSDADEVFHRPETLRMSEIQESNSLVNYSRGVLSIISAIYPPPDLVNTITETFVDALRSSPVRSI